MPDVASLTLTSVLARSRGTTLNRLIDDMATELLAQDDAEIRFRLWAARGAGKESAASM